MGGGVNDHKNKHIRAAVDYALSKGWRLVPAGPRAHIWGTLYCCHAGRDGHFRRVYCTPRVPEDHAKQICRAVDACQHSKEANP
jgi:hypothetical protein